MATVNKDDFLHFPTNNNDHTHLSVLGHYTSTLDTSHFIHALDYCRHRLLIYFNFYEAQNIQYQLTSYSAR